jgi:hypothetical protein
MHATTRSQSKANQKKKGAKRLAQESLGSH